MGNFKHLVILFILFTSILSCKSDLKIDSEAIKQEVLIAHNLSQKYHIEKMAEEFVNQLSNNHISVNRGKISHLIKKDKLKQVKQYFNSVEFEKWDDIAPPIIRFSADYSMVYTVVNKEVIVSFTDKDGINKKENTIFSWVAIYTKQDGEWKVDCVASTNQPSVNKIQS